MKRTGTLETVSETGLTDDDCWAPRLFLRPPGRNLGRTLPKFGLPDVVEVDSVVFSVDWVVGTCSVGMDATSGIVAVVVIS